MKNEETIAAIATPRGHGGVAIIRLSGREALKVASRVVSPCVRGYKSHTVHRGKILDSEGKTLDEVLIIPMLGTRSYTGEETIEIHCHGGPLISQQILSRVLSSGARAAEPGEFTLRAFLNGKIDLAQAEAVQLLIAAKNEASLKAANSQLEGALSKKIRSLENALIEIGAMLEASIDFPEEDITFHPQEETKEKLNKVIEEMKRLLESFEEAMKIQKGIRLIFIGSPNVGKSSLFNRLLQEERAIVTDIPGTTRDTIEAEIHRGSLHLTLVDTAGLCDSHDPIEKEGINRSKKAIETGDMILFVLDASRTIHEEEKSLLTTLPKDKTLLVWNKIDIKTSSHSSHELKRGFPLMAEVSALKNQGIESLLEIIEKTLSSQYTALNEEVYLTSERHKRAMMEAMTALDRVKRGFKEALSPEFLAEDIKKALYALNSLIGISVSEEILKTIFSKFCIGK